MIKNYLKNVFCAVAFLTLSASTINAQSVLLDKDTAAGGVTTWNITTTHPHELILIAADGYGGSTPLSTAPGTVTVNGNNATFIANGNWWGGYAWSCNIWAYEAPTVGTYTLNCTEIGLQSPYYLNYAASVYDPTDSLKLGDIIIGGHDSNQSQLAVTTTITTTKSNSFIYGTANFNDNPGSGVFKWFGLTQLGYNYIGYGIDCSHADSTVATPGTYTITASDTGASSPWATILLIAVQPPCSLVADSVTNTSICQGNCTNIDVAFTGGTPGYTYSWSNGGTLDTINVCPVADSSFTLTITDSQGCMSTGKVHVKVNPLPTVMMSISKDTTCVSMTKDSLIGSPLGGTFSGAGVTGSNFDPSTAGIGAHTITYTYTDSAGCSASDSAWVIVASCTGINEVNSLNNLVSFYPNPFAESLSINVGANGPVTITMFNTMGQNLGSWQMEQGMHTISTQSLPAGVYSIQVKSKDGLVNKKLVKVN